MAESTIGLLRVVLSSNAAEFSSDMGKAAGSVGQFNKDAKAASGNLTALAGGAQSAEKSTGLLATSVGKLAAGFSAALIVDRVISGVIGFGREAFESAGKIVDLADKTGLTMRSIQEMEHAAKLTGTSLDTFTTAAFQLGVRLSSGSGSVVSAVQQLGLSYRDLQALSPDEQFRLIADRLGEMENAQDRNKLAVELFGRAAKDILPAIASGYREIAESAIIAGDQQILALDMASDALDTFYSSAKNLTVELLGGLVIAVRETWRTFKEGMDTALTPFTAGWELATDAMKAWGLAAQDIPRVQGPASAGLKDLSTPAKALTMSFTEMDDISKKLTESIGKKTAVVRTHTSALQSMVPAVQAVYGPSEELFGLESRTLQQTAALTVALERWAQVNGAVLAPSIQQVNASLVAQQPLLSSMQLQWTQFPGTVTQSTAQAGTSTEGFFSRVFGGAQGLSTSLTSIFQQAFTGGGGALGAAKAFATQGMSALLGMIPGVGPFAQAFAGPIVAMLSNLGGKFKEFFSTVFGGPSQSERQGRSRVAEFEDELHDALSATQKLEAGNESWKMTVIALRDKYIEMGRTEEEALIDARRLWESSKISAEESARVIEEIRQKLVTLPTERTITVNVEYNDPGHSAPSGGDPGFALGTKGRTGSWFKDFGASTATKLHGVEAVLRPQDAPAFAMDVMRGMTSPAAVVEGGGGMGVTVVVNAQGAFFDDYASMERLAQKISRALDNRLGTARLSPGLAGVR